MQEIVRDIKDGEVPPKVIHGSMFMKISKKMSQEEICAVVSYYESKNWVAVGSSTLIVFLSPCGMWINYIDPETGEKWYLDREIAEKKGFYVSLKEKSVETCETEVSK